MKNKITLVLFTHNSESRLKLSNSFLGNFDELLAIDDNSNDKTKVLLKKQGFKIYSERFIGDFALRHNLAFAKSRNDWVFFLDDDERPDTKLSEAIFGTALTDYAGFELIRKDMAWGAIVRYGEQGNIKIVRLVNRKKGKWVRKVHEYFATSGKIGKLEGSLLHDQKITVEGFLDKINLYGPIDAVELARERKQFGYIQLLKPGAKFVWNYFFRFGFLDGYRGLALAYLMAVQSLAVRVYQWELKTK